LQDVTALHISIGASTNPSVSTQIALLRRLLNGEGKGDLSLAFSKITKVGLGFTIKFAKVAHHEATRVKYLLSSLLIVQISWRP
jgi:hypothetical protein